MRLLLWLAVLCAAASDVCAQGVLTGTFTALEYAGGERLVPMTAVHCFASALGGDAQAIGFRTWEMHPAGWYYLPGPAGNYSVVFSDPSGFVRPLVLTNQFLADGEKLTRPLTARFDYADFYQGKWDEKPATEYYQTFMAQGTSVTSIGFRLATDGVDGPGPEANRVLISVHRKTSGTPDTWPQVGPTALVPNVDCGGPKNYVYSAGFNSGEVPTVAGGVYAVRLRPQSPEHGLQAFWRPVGDSEIDCYRIGPDRPPAWQGRNLCMTVASDVDGLVIPYNKCVHEKFKEFAGFAGSWSQTYVARGTGLAAVMLYAATSGTQPSMNRQRLSIRVRKGGPAGEVTGTAKIAIGNGNYTGDASWGVFGACFAPGEVRLVPGELYAVEFASMENYYTLHGFVNIKGQASDLKAGFNPYRKCPPDSYSNGSAYRYCRDEQDFDLDMQIIEYEHGSGNWPEAVEGPNLLANGDMEAGEDMPSDWRTFKIAAETGLMRIVPVKEKDSAVARVHGGSSTGKEADGGFVQRVDGLSKLETYRLSGQVRSTWPVDEKHACMVGYDCTGQAENPQAETIKWQVMPALHGVFVKYMSEPIRPRGDSISVWLRAKTTLTDDYPFRADFDHFALYKIATGPGPQQD